MLRKASNEWNDLGIVWAIPIRVKRLLRMNLIKKLFSG